MKTVSRIKWMSLLAVLALVLAACGTDEGVDAETTTTVGEATTTTADTSPEPATVRFTVFPGAIPSMGVYVADGMGFFAEEGITLEYVTVGTGSSALQVLAAGETDFTISDLTGTASARTAGADVVFVSAQFHRFMAELVCQPDFELPDGGYPATMEALAGATLGITAPGSATDTYLRYSMIAAGVDPASAEIIPIGGVPQLLAAFDARSVECLVAYQPMQSLLPEHQSAVDWEAGEGPDAFDTYVFNGIVTSESFDAESPDVVRRVAAAMEKAVTFASDPNNADVIAENTVQFFEGLDQETLAQIVRDGAGTYGYEITPEHIANAAEVYQATSGNELGGSYDDLIADSVAG